MSKIALSGNASGTGTFTFAAPGTNTDRTLTLPDAAGTMVLADATQTLTNKSIDAAQLTGDVAAARITTALNATGSAPIYACRAWVNFNGTGTVAIRASGNVSSITDNGTGDYTVNFATAMPDANYAVMSFSNGIPLDDGATARTASAFRFNTYNFAGVKFDTSVVNVAVFR